MSLSAYKFDNKHIGLVVDPRIDFSQDAIYAVNAGGQHVTFRNYPSQNFSGNEISINTTQSMDVAIASKVFVNVTFRVSFTGNPGPNERLVQIGTNDALRFMPLTSVTKTISIDINDETFTTAINDYHDALMRYNNTEDEMGFDFSGTPMFLDSYQQYADNLLYGTALNALGNQGENSRQEPLRGGFPYRVIYGNGLGETSATLEFDVCEPILVSPLTWGHHNTKALIGVKSFNINYTLSNDLTRVWSHASTGAPNFLVTGALIVGAPSAQFCYITPKKSIPIPRLQRYPYANVYKSSKIINSGAPLAPGQSIRGFTSDAMPLYGVPKRAYIFARRQNADRTFNTTDTYARIDKLSVYFHNEDGIFSQATSQQLYRISAENGYRSSYAGWSQYEGSVFCMDFSKDVPLQTDEAVASNENIQFQYTIDITNPQIPAVAGPPPVVPPGQLPPSVPVDPYSDSVVYTLFTIVVFEGVLTIDNGVISRELNIVSPKDVVDSNIMQMLPYHQVNDYLSGGSFSSRFKKFASNVGDVGRKAIDIGKKVSAAIPDNVKQDIKKAALGTLETVSPRVAAVAETLGPIAFDIAKSLAGEGYTENQIYKYLIQYGQSQTGSGMKMDMKKGGKRLTQKELKRLAMM